MDVVGEALAWYVRVWEQIVEVIDPAARDRRLEELLRKYHASRKNRILVFVLYKKEAARVESQLSKRGWNVSPSEPQCQVQCHNATLNAAFISLLG